MEMNQNHFIITEIEKEYLLECLLDNENVTADKNGLIVIEENLNSENELQATKIVVNEAESKVLLQNIDASSCNIEIARDIDNCNIPNYLELITWDIMISMFIKYVDVVTVHDYQSQFKYLFIGMAERLCGDLFLKNPGQISVILNDLKDKLLKAYPRHLPFLYMSTWHENVKPFPKFFTIKNGWYFVPFTDKGITQCSIIMTIEEYYQYHLLYYPTSTFGIAALHLNLNIPKYMKN